MAFILGIYFEPSPVTDDRFLFCSVACKLCAIFSLFRWKDVFLHVSNDVSCRKIVADNVYGSAIVRKRASDSDFSTIFPYYLREVPRLPL